MDGHYFILHIPVISRKVEVIKYLFDHVMDINKKKLKVNILFFI